MKKSINYVLLVVVFIVLVCSITITTLFIKYKDKGNFILNRTYSDVLFTNTIIETDNDVKIKLDNDKKSIHVETGNLNENTEFTIDIKNIGNKDIKVKNYSFSNIDTNGNKDNVKITASVKEGDIIKGSDSIKLNVLVEYTGKKEEGLYLNFNINYLFEEVNV